MSPVVAVGVVLAAVGATVFILVFGEIVHKSCGPGHAESCGLRVARPITHVERATGPIVSLFDTGTRWLTDLVGGDQHIEDASPGE